MMVAIRRAHGLLLVMASISACRSQPLPSDMVASFGAEQTWADQLYLPVNDSAAFIRARLSLENAPTSESRVAIDWHFKAPGALPRSTHESIPVFFKPTAVARRAGTTSTFYVVGWDERTGRVSIESWTLPDTYRLGSHPAEDGGAAVSNFEHPEFVREAVWTSNIDSMQPVWDAACQPVANPLLLLPRGSPTRILALDLTSKRVSEMYSATAGTPLEGDRNVVIGKNELSGFIAMTSGRRQWEHGRKVPPTEQYFVMYDSDSDGVFESTGTVPVDALSSAIPGAWDDRYEE